MTSVTQATFAEEVKAAASLIEAVRALSSARSLHEVIGISIRAARQATRADGVSFVLREGDECHYVDEVSIAPLWKGMRVPMAACVTGWSMHHRAPLAIPDAEHDPRVPAEVYGRTFVRSLAVVPVRCAEPVGAISVCWGRTGAIAQETIHWLQALADATGAVLDAVHARSEAELVSEILSQATASRENAEVVRMCAWTRRILHDGHWISLEAFLRVRFGLLVSHGISDEAMAALQHELAENYEPSGHWISG